MSSVVDFLDLRPPAQEWSKYKPSGEETIVIDNGDKITSNQITLSQSTVVSFSGSYNLRVGFSGQSWPVLSCRPLFARTRREKGKEAELLVANDLASLDAYRYLQQIRFCDAFLKQF